MIRYSLPRCFSLSILDSFSFAQESTLSCSSSIFFGAIQSGWNSEVLRSTVFGN